MAGEVQSEVGGCVELVGGPMCGMVLGEWPDSESRIWFPSGGLKFGYALEECGKAVCCGWLLLADDEE